VLGVWQRARCRRGAAMEHSRKPIVGIDRRQHPDIVPSLPQLACEFLDVCEDTAGICVGVWANKSYAHTRSVARQSA
jgi:hypothetical protein